MINEAPITGGPSIEEQVATNKRTMDYNAPPMTNEGGYQAPIPTTAEALAALDPVQKFDYERGLKSFTPTELLDHMQNDKAVSDSFDIAKGREIYGDSGLINKMMKDSDNTRANIMNKEYGGINDYTKGFGKTIAGAGIAISDAVNAVGNAFNDSNVADKANVVSSLPGGLGAAALSAVGVLDTLGVTDNKEHNTRVAKLRTFIKDVDASMDNHDLISLGMAGEIGAEMALLPISVQTRIGTFLAGSVLGYANSRGQGNEVGTAAVTGAVVGTLGVGAREALIGITNKLTGKVNEKVYNYYKDQFGVTDEKAQAVLNDYTKIMGSSGDETKDKLMSIFEYSGNKGAELKGLFGWMSNESIGALEKPMRDRHRAIVGLTEGDFSLPEFGKVLAEKNKIIKQNYGVTTMELGHKYGNSPIVGDVELPKLVDEVATDRQAVKQLLVDGATIEDYIDAMPHINSILAKSKGIHKNEWGDIKNKVNDKIHETLEPEDFMQWSQINADYSKMAQVMESKIGKAVNRAISTKSDNITVPRALDLLKANKDGGEVTYKMLQDIVGSEQVAKFEKSAIRDVVNVHADDVSWETFNNVIKTKGFVTEEGKRLQGLLETLDRNFNTDKALQHIASGKNLPTNIATTIDGKIKMWALGNIFSKAAKYLPLESSKNTRRQDALFNVLKSEHKVLEFEKVLNTMSEGVKAKYLNSLIATEAPKLLEHFGEPKTKKIATNLINEAVIEDSIPPVVISDGLEDVLKDAMFSKLNNKEKNQVIGQAFEHMGDPMVVKRMQAAGNLMVEGRVEANAAKAHKIITTEAELMMRAIRKDAGLNPNVMDKAMMEDLVTYVMKQATKDCK